MPLVLIILAFTGQALFENWQLRQEPAEVSVRLAAKAKTFADVAEGYAAVFHLAAEKIASGEIKSADELSKYATPLNIEARKKAQETYRVDWPQRYGQQIRESARRLQSGSRSFRIMATTLDRVA